ncbi:hypothetical protein [Bacillus cereus]|uniref:hypothetical protein n=1 Tax=Bacillus cereus TaxID=1396 RepID=UPI00285292F8|nr:hypothetical protein [Bacillus cereus]WLE91087.1 hypothetical protein GGBNIMDK_00118 [Bacillus cereus]
MKKINLMSSMLFTIVISTLSISTPVKAAPEDSVYKSWNSAREYMGYNALQEEYQNGYNEYLKQQQEDDKLVLKFFKRIMVKRVKDPENTVKISERVSTENIGLEIERSRKITMKKVYDAYYK